MIVKIILIIMSSIFAFTCTKVFIIFKSDLTEFNKGFCNKQTDENKMINEFKKLLGEKNKINKFFNS